MDIDRDGIACRAPRGQWLLAAAPLLLASLLAARGARAEDQPPLDPRDDAEPALLENEEEVEEAVPSVITARGLVDTYYAYDFGAPVDNLRPGFLYNHNRHDEFSINTALIELGYEGPWARAQVGLMAGTYAQYNYAHELPMLRSIYQAWVGVELAPRLWWDAGVFPSHIGWESALSPENPTLTRSIASANSPFYLAGTRLYWEPDERWTLGLVVANGWQNITETPGNSSKGVGTQVTWEAIEGALTLNSSTWVSDEFPAADPRLRLFHDLYGLITPFEALSLVAGFDIGAQQAGQEVGPGWQVWWTAALISRLELSQGLATALRLEYYHDPHEIIIVLDDAPGVRVAGASLGLDVTLAEPALLRVEARALRDADEIFRLAGEPSRLNLAVTAGLAISFDAALGLEDQ